MKVLGESCATKILKLLRQKGVYSQKTKKNKGREPARMG